MIYLFKKRNGQIIGCTAQSADAMYNTPNNFTTFRPIYLGAVADTAFKQASDQSEEDVPIAIEKLVMRDGVETMLTLDQFQIQDAIANGDKGMEGRLAKLHEKRQKRHQELLQALSDTADKNAIPPSYSRKIGAVEDVRGDVSGVLRGYVNEPV